MLLMLLIPASLSDFLNILILSVTIFSKPRSILKLRSRNWEHCFGQDLMVQQRFIILNQIHFTSYHCLVTWKVVQPILYKSQLKLHSHHLHSIGSDLKLAGLQQSLHGMQSVVLLDILFKSTKLIRKFLSKTIL